MRLLWAACYDVYEFVQSLFLTHISCIRVRRFISHI